MTPFAPLQKRLQICALVVLVSGFLSAIVIYGLAEQNTEPTMVDAYLQSKSYSHELQAYGGKASLLADELSRGFASLWQGQNLAFTIAVLSLLVAALLIWLARHPDLVSASHQTPRDQSGVKQ